MKNIIKSPLSTNIKKNKKNIVTIMLILILSIVVIILNITSCKSNDNPGLQTLASSLDSLKFVHDKTMSEYGASKIRFDELANQKAYLDSQELKKTTEIEKLKKEIKRLKNLNSRLASKNKKARKQEAPHSNELTATVEMYKEQLKELQVEKDKLSKQLADLMTKYNVLKELASIAHASNIRFEPEHEKKNGKKERPVTKARKMNLLRIKFDIDENLIPEDGKKNLYVVIDGPDGKLLSNEKNKSGSFTASDGSVIAYSMAKEINIQHGAPVNDLVAEWKQEGEHKKGNYTVAIYNDGHKVGIGSVNLR